MTDLSDVQTGLGRLVHDVRESYKVWLSTQKTTQNSKNCSVTGLSKAPSTQPQVLLVIWQWVLRTQEDKLGLSGKSNGRMRLRTIPGRL